MNTQIHIPVLSEPVLMYLDPKPGERYLDLTAGYGGHASIVLDKLGPIGSATLVDRDQSAIDHLKKKFKNDKRISIIHNDFYSASTQLQGKGEKYDLILADIGLSSPHLDNAERGFSFMNAGPLDMRMDNRQALTAADIVNNWDEKQLRRLFQLYGEIRGAGRIARSIIEHRPILTTTELASIIQRSTRGYPKVRYEAQIFQAIRIAVNEELRLLEQSLPIWHDLLAPNGRLGVISFHSLEDRLVKQYFSEHSGKRYDADFNLLTKTPVSASTEESVFNPRSRSAKLRVAQRK